MGPTKYDCSFHACSFKFDLLYQWSKHFFKWRWLLDHSILYIWLAGETAMMLTFLMFNTLQISRRYFLVAVALLQLMPLYSQTLKLYCGLLPSWQIQFEICLPYIIHIIITKLTHAIFYSGSILLAWFIFCWHAHEVVSNTKVSKRVHRTNSREQ